MAISRAIIIFIQIAYNVSQLRSLKHGISEI